MADYVQYFERLSVANAWDDERKAVIFPSLLEVGNKSLDGLSDATLSSFSSIKKALLGDSEPFRESNFSELWHISRKKGETLQAYRERIAGLVEKVYPRFAAGNKQCVIRDIFVHSLPSDYQKFLLGANTTKIDEALNSALMYESMQLKMQSDLPRFSKPPFNKSIGKFECSQQQDAGKIAPIRNSTSKNTNECCHFCGFPGILLVTVVKRRDMLSINLRMSRKI